MPVALDPRVDPTSELAICAVSGTDKQPSWAASCSKPTTGAVDLSTGAAIREDPGSAAGACCCHCCCCCCCCSFHDDCSSRLAFLRLVTVRTGVIILSDHDLVCAYVVHSSLILPCVVFIDAPSNAARACALACFRRLGWTTLYLNNT